MTGRENLPYLEDDVFADESVITTVLEDYEISLEDDWSDFIKDFCL
jgi:hypothetical protein